MNTPEPEKKEKVKKEVKVKVKKEVKVKEIKVKKEKVKKEKVKKEPEIKNSKVLKGYYDENINVIEIGVDEAGRGPLFGRVYSAAVILPKNGTFDYSKVKDSKKFTSKTKIEEAAQYIKENALAWHVSYSDEKTIDTINILQATQLSMHDAILETRKKYNATMFDTKNTFHLLIDGNYFNPITVLNETKTQIIMLTHTTIQGGDNLYASIAAASILAKVERDKYIQELCIQHPTLIEYYGIDSNKGYGAKKHMDGIKLHGITEWHRKSYAPCNIINNNNNNNIITNDECSITMLNSN